MNSGNVLEIVRPPKVTVGIFGQTYTVRRLRYPAMIKIVALVADVAVKSGLLERLKTSQKLVATDVLEALISQVQVLDEFSRLLLEESLPDFKDTDDLSVEDMIQLVQKLWEVNQVGKAFERFFAQMGTSPQVNPAP